MVVRPAEVGDRAKIFAFLQEVWDGKDYLPTVWDDWAADPAGHLVVAELEGQPIGTGRIANLGWGEYWLEGFRVAAPYRRNGVAGRIQQHLLSFWDGQGGGSVGYLTHRDQLAVHRLAKSAGFNEKFRVHMLRWASVDGEHDFQPCEDIEWAVHKLSAGSIANALDGRMEFDWTFPRILSERVAKLENVYAWKGDRAVVVLNRDDWDGRPIAALACTSMPSDDSKEFFHDLGRLCSMLDLDGGRWFAPLDWLERLDFDNAGLDLVEDLEMVCYMKHR